MKRSWKKDGKEGKEQRIDPSVGSAKQCTYTNRPWFISPLLEIITKLSHCLPGLHSDRKHNKTLDILTPGVFSIWDWRTLVSGLLQDVTFHKYWSEMSKVRGQRFRSHNTQILVQIALTYSALKWLFQSTVPLKQTIKANQFHSVNLIQYRSTCQDNMLKQQRCK